MKTGIRQAYSSATDAYEAAQEFYKSVAQTDMVLVMFFCSADYDLKTLAAELSRLFAGIQVIGCTTAGEIGPGGYREHGLAGASFAAEACTAVSGSIDNLQSFEISDGQALGQRLLQELELIAPQANPDNSFALLLVDGLSVREESVARALQSALGKVPLTGGSAGDGLDFHTTHVYVDGNFRSNCATLTVITTPLPFTVFKTQHFVSTDQRLVITAADTATRVVNEINGLPAAQEYARLLGVNSCELSPTCFAASPVVVLIDGNNYVRSIQKVNADGSLTFYCAIEEGLVLR
ncbi:MAG: FIST domain containing protein, partial [Acidobacteriota bacterium]|nr:FIST domain containing protein [Acidobacteriota bacterium]